MPRAPTSWTTPTIVCQAGMIGKQIDAALQPIVSLSMPICMIVGQSGFAPRLADAIALGRSVDDPEPAPEHQIDGVGFGRWFEPSRDRHCHI